ncbi:DUF2024 family protein [Candidatus Kuenenia sp.]
MKVAAYDTHVIKKSGVIMHFDIIIPKCHIMGKVPKVEHLKENPGAIG